MTITENHRFAMIVKQVMDGNVNFVAANAMKIMASVLTMIVIRWIYNHKSHDSSEKGEDLLREWVDEYKELKQLIIENPDLPLIFFATDEANSGEYSSELADARAHKGIVLNCTGIQEDHIYTDEDDLESDISDMLFDEHGHDWSDEEYEAAITEKMKEYEPYWVNAIIITVDDY